MLEVAFVAAVVSVATMALHIATTALALLRCARSSISDQPSKPSADLPPVTILRPLRGVDPFDELTLRSAFEVDYPKFEVVLCCADASDAAVPLARRLIASYPQIDARLLIGDSAATANPKLNNLLKGWRAARYDWIAMADCNVFMPPDYLTRLVAAWRPETGLVCSPPIGCLAEGLWAEVECAFLNTYQARWQYAADTVGLGFAQGKTMLARRSELDAAGGLETLGQEMAEDAAATKVIRGLGKHVHLIDRPFSQPLGRRTVRQVWSRQTRWARLRRVTFPAFFAPEVLTTSLLTVLSAALAADYFEVEPIVAVGFAALIWFGCEALLAQAAGWQLTFWSPIAWIIRDALLPVVWGYAWLSSSVSWRGNDIRVARATASD